MFKFFTKILLLLLLSAGLYAQSGLTQIHLVSVSPDALATGVSADTIIEVVFDKPIVASSVKKNTIKLKGVKGVTTLVRESTLLFTPNEALKSATHKVKVKKIKLQNTDSSNAEHKPTRDIS